MNECDGMGERLDAYVDGTLPAYDRSAVEQHLAGCSVCRAEAAAIRSLLSDARALPRDITPPRDLWTGIASRTGKGGGLVVRAAGVRRRPAIRVALLAAAALALMVTGGVLATWWQRRSAPREFAASQARYQAAAATLATDLSHDPGGLSAATRAVLHQNLAILDQAIREAEAALTADPGNRALEQMLVARYEQRLTLLRHAAGAGRRES